MDGEQSPSTIVMDFYEPKPPGFGWDLPPGCTMRDIDENAGVYDDDPDTEDEDYIDFYSDKEDEDMSGPKEKVLMRKPKFARWQEVLITSGPFATESYDAGMVVEARWSDVYLEFLYDVKIMNPFVTCLIPFVEGELKAKKVRLQA